MKFAYFTLATDRRYLEGAYKLYKSFLRTNSKYPFYCAVWKDTDTTGYENMPTYIIPKFLPVNKRFTYDPPAGVFSKVASWLIEGFDYILMVDCDFIWYKNTDDIIDQYLSLPYNDIIMSAVGNPNNAHDYYNCAWMFMKPNKEKFMKAYSYFNIAANESEIFTYMADNKEIKVVDCHDAPDMFDHIFHFNNWYHGEKYWENELGKKIYDMLMNDTSLLPTIKEIQFLIARQPYEYSRPGSNKDMIAWRLKNF